MPVATLGRFQVLSLPAVAPGKCACCGSVERPVVDFGFDVDFYGTVYLCRDCIRDAAEQFDMVPLIDLRKEQAARQQAETVQHEVETAIREYHDNATALWTRLSSRLTGFYGPGNGDSGSSGGVPPNQETIPSIPNPPERTTRQEPEPVIDEGPISLSVSSSDEPDSDGFRFD